MNERERHEHSANPRGRPTHHDQRDGERPDRRSERGSERGFRLGRMRRGDVRTALLIALLDGPAHGYELIQALETKTAGRWRPSPGSVYPSLQMLADEDLVVSHERDGKRVFELSETGRARATEQLTTHGAPWEAMERRDPERGGLRAAVRDLHVAAKAVGVAGSTEAVERATAIVVQARKDLYQLLVES